MNLPYNATYAQKVLLYKWENKISKTLDNDQSFSILIEAVLPNIYTHIEDLNKYIYIYLKTFGIKHDLIRSTNRKGGGWKHIYAYI